MKRLLSSRTTFFWKYIFTFIWVVGMGLFAAYFIFGNPKFTFAPGTTPAAAAAIKTFAKWHLGILWSLGCLFLLWLAGPLKRVFIDDSWLYVSNYFTETTIPLADISGVRENRRVHIGGHHPIIVELREGSQLGKRVVFIPTGKAPFSWPWKPKDHPVAAELKVIAERNRLAAVPESPFG